MTSSPTSTHRTPSAERRSPFEAALREAADIAALSPSSHNCQPWGVAWPVSSGARQAAARRVDEARGGGTSAESISDGSDGSDGCDGSSRSEYVVLALDRERELTSLPAHAVEMQLSCGAYLQILLRSLALLGWSTDGIGFVEPRPGEQERGRSDFHRRLGDTWPASWSPLCAVRLRRTGPPSGALAELRRTARARVTNRAPYRTEAVEPAVLAGLRAPSAGVAEGAEVTVRHLVADSERAVFADVVARHGGRDFSHRQAWRETHSFLRRNEAEAAAQGDGFALSQLFGPMSGPRRLALRTALAPTTMRVLRYAGYHRVLARQLARVVRPTPVVVAMSFADSVPGLEATVRGGAHLAEYWMRATDAGLALHPVSVVLQHDDVRTELQDRLGLPGRTFFVSRLGRSLTEFPPSRRRIASSAVRPI
ncbi:RedV protein [Streptomyces aurantiacus]|uniref:RedV protein n=1 Tax=Streptomyces aurantiacus TaxID=47760 RepID=A0A7G1PHC9_9ACTN|nr:RedV protein [Streptomyces aurantiacus]BCL32965.1 RedV protein [Streptomyces aurantiacus]